MSDLDSLIKLLRSKSTHTWVQSDADPQWVTRIRSDGNESVVHICDPHAVWKVANFSEILYAEDVQLASSKAGPLTTDRSKCYSCGVSAPQDLTSE